MKYTFLLTATTAALCGGAMWAAQGGDVHA